MPKARQQYFADETSIQKEKKEFAIEDSVMEKINSIEAGAQVNVIETVKVNGEALTPDENKAVDISVPGVEDNLYSTSTTDALSAKQGKVLYEYIQNAGSRGRYLSNWNCTTGLPMTNPVDNPYQYRAGDYYVVSVVAAQGGTNYRPDGSEYTAGLASTVVEQQTVKVGDFYTYDGTQWLLLINTERPIAIDTAMSSVSTNPVENRVITQALTTKQDTIFDLATIRSGAALGATSIQPGDSLSQLTGTADDITEGVTNLFLTSAERTKLGNTTGTNTGDETNATIKTKLGAASSSNDGYLTSTDWSTFNGKQDAISDLSTIRSNASAGKSASDTIATYGDIVTHDVSEFATATQGTLADTAIQPNDNISELTNDAGYITDAYHDNTKQDTLIAGTNIQIAADGKTISATDTTYVAGDFDIKDLADSTGLRTTWSGKQDELIAGTNIQIAADGKTISSTDTTYTAGPGISISNNNVISNTQTSAEWGNIIGTLADQTDLKNALDAKQGELTAGDNITIEERCGWDTQGPAPSGFHVPTKDEWDALLLILFTTLSLPSYHTTLRDYLKMTLAGLRGMTDGSVSSQGYGYYWASTASDSYDAYCISAGSGSARVTSIARSNAASIRCFKNTPVLPDNSWTTLYDGSSVAAGAGIFHNTIDGLISISGDGVAWYTIQDKNLGATQVWNSGDEVSDANSGYFYQRGNNYGFPHSGTITTSSTQVDASNYGPGNYYSSSTFITRSYGDSDWDWSSTSNNNLRGGVSQGQGCNFIISSTDTTYTAGTGISIDANNVISNTQTSAEWGNISGTLADQTDLKNALDAKQDDMVILSYGSSTWNDFITAYNKNGVVYCRASSNSNPATGSQTRLAFMAYVNDATTPTEVEFQYYRSRSDHNSAANQLDEVYVYKLNSNGTWSVVVRNTAAKAVAGTGIGLTFGSGNMTISNSGVTSVNGDTGAVTIPESDTKTFYLNGTSDLTTAQDIYDWYDAGKNPLVYYTPSDPVERKGLYIFSGTYSTNGISFIFPGLRSLDNGMGDASSLSLDKIFILTNNGTVNRINYGSGNGAGSYLDTLTDYSTPYTPVYAGSPATKKYVDDNISAATQGAVSDDAYAASWDGITGIAPSKNAVYDKISAMDTTIAGKQDTISDLGSIRTKANSAVQPLDNVSTLTNDAGYITKAVSDLTNYYTKSETYTKQEVADYVANFAGFKVVATLPTTDIKTTIIYLLGPVGSGQDKYEEYIYSNNTWVMIGETSVDLTNYFNTSTQTSDAITQGSTNLFLTSAERTKLSNTSNTNTGDETKTTIQTKLGAATSSNDGYLSSADWQTFNGKLGTSAISDAAYGSGWDADTTHAPSKNAVYDKINAMDTTIGGKQDALTAQTAYTSKGSATKVPQITTNTLGQVTGITEVNISYPSQVSDTAYGSSWDGVTTEAPSKNAVYDKISAMDTTISGKADATNVKVFSIASTSDLTNAIAAYDWYKAGKTPVLDYGNNIYTLYSVSSSKATFLRAYATGDVTGTGNRSRIYHISIVFTLTGSGSSKTVSAVSTSTQALGYFLATGQDYSSPYTPEYDGSPATKKYVDDAVAQAGGGDMSYSDFGWQAKTGATITLDLASTYTPSANFTVNAPATIKDGQTYILRVENGSTAYEMTLGTNVTNPYETDTTLTADGIDQFVFLAIGGNLELQPEGGGGGGGGGAITSNTTGTTTSISQIWVGTEAEYAALTSYDENVAYMTY